MAGRNNRTYTVDIWVQPQHTERYVDNNHICAPYLIEREFYKIYNFIMSGLGIIIYFHPLPTFFWLSL